MLTADVLSRLTTRERQILEMLTTGAQNKEIAHALGIANGTVKVHIKAVLKKIGARNRTAAAVYALSLPDSFWRRERDASFHEAVAMAVGLSGPLVLQGGLASPTPTTPHEPPHLRIIESA